MSIRLYSNDNGLLEEWLQSEGFFIPEHQQSESAEVEVVIINNNELSAEEEAEIVRHARGGASIILIHARSEVKARLKKNFKRVRVIASDVSRGIYELTHGKG